jgi:hypothetical protein
MELPDLYNIEIDLDFAPDVPRKNQDDMMMNLMKTLANQKAVKALTITRSNFEYEINENAVGEGYGQKYKLNSRR